MSPQWLNDYRPVALTSVIMKCFEFLFKINMQSILPDGFDKYQFAYRKNRSVEDAISILVHEILKHLESKNASTFHRSSLYLCRQSSSFNNSLFESFDDITY